MYGVLITGKVDEETLYQVIVAYHNGNEYTYSRYSTNNGRGISNAWNPVSKQLAILGGKQNDMRIHGEVIATPITDVDKASLSNHQIPNVLVQKLTKQYKSRPQYATTQHFDSVITKVFSLSENPEALAEYHTDKRRKTQDEQPTNQVTNQVIHIQEREEMNPVIQVVRENSRVPKLTKEIEGYIERTFAGGLTETDIFDHAIKNKHNVRIVGEAGTGKTLSPMAYAYKRGLDYERIDCHAGIENSQFFGSYVPDGEGGLVWQDGIFTRCFRNGNAVLVLDETSFMTTKQQGGLMPCLASTRTLTLLEHGGEVIPAGDNLLIVASYNENYRGNNRLNEALEDRFYHKLVFTYDREIEKNFIPSSTLLTLAEQMRADSLVGTYETPISTRLLKNFVSSARELSYDYAVESLVNSFTAEERASVKLLLDAHRHNLEQELTGKIN